MKLNFGLLLRRPGESSYARYRRFLISNRSIAFPKIRRELEKNFYGEDMKHSGSVGPNKLANYAAQLEEQFLQSHSLATQQYNILFHRYYPKQCCNSCASEAYHCDLFDIPGVRICPIHNEVLSEQCQKCGFFWPTAAMIPFRNCSVCGCDTKINEIKSSLIKNCKIYQQIANFKSLLELGNEKFSQSFFLIRQKRGVKIAEPILSNYSPSRFYICVLSKAIPGIVDVSELLDSSFNITKKTYPVELLKDPRTLITSERNHKLKIKIIKSAIIKLKKIFNTKGHALGECKTYDFPWNGCQACAMFRAWKLIVDCGGYAIDDTLEEYLQVLDINRLLIGKAVQETPVIYSLFYVMESNNTGQYIKLPDELVEILYENDLLAISLILYEHFKRIVDKVSDEPKIAMLDIYNSYLSSKTIYKSLCPSMLELKGSKLDVYFPHETFNNSFFLRERFDSLSSC